MTEALTTIDAVFFLKLLVFFQIKHFFADYVFQNVWLLQKDRPGWDFVLPLSIHAGVHAALTTLAVQIVNPSMWWLGLLDFGVHFVMDRIKAGPRYLGRFRDVKSNAYWISFGFDQMVHHLTHIYIAWHLVAH